MQPIIVKGHHVRVQTPSPGEAYSPALVHHAEEPAVRILREGGVVHAIEVRCSCGTPTVVQLDYEQTAPGPTPPPDESPPDEPPLSEPFPNEDGE